MSCCAGKKCEEEFAHANSREYYGKVLESAADLKTSCCTTASASVPAYIRHAIGKIHDDVVSRYYGCGVVLPPCLDGATVLDLGCGAGHDCYVAMQTIAVLHPCMGVHCVKLVGASGQVIGVDMTDEQLAVARKYIEHHTSAFGYPSPNVEFRKGYIEDLSGAEIADESVDVIVSNCVLNLCEHKDKVLREAMRVLKEGGEMYFSDVYCDRRLPEHMQRDKLLHGECIGGALYWKDFLHMAASVGFHTPILVSDSAIELQSEVRSLVGDARFFSATYRLIKARDLEHSAEDYGQDVPTKVDRNTYRKLASSRYAAFLSFMDGKGAHLGTFAGCGEDLPFRVSAPRKSCCC